MASHTLDRSVEDIKRDFYFFLSVLELANVKNTFSSSIKSLHEVGSQMRLTDKIRQEENLLIHRGHRRKQEFKHQRERE